MVLLFFWLCHTACKILAPQPGIEPVLPAVEAWSPNHWKAREIPSKWYFWKNKAKCLEVVNTTRTLTGPVKRFEFYLESFSVSKTQKDIWPQGAGRKDGYKYLGGKEKHFKEQVKKKIFLGLPWWSKC